MKVLHLVSSLQYGGGLERIVVDLIVNNNDSENLLCIINDIWSEEFLNELNKKNVLLCNRTEGSKNIVNNLRVFVKLIKFIRKNNVEVIHCHNVFSLKIAYVLKKILKVSVVFTIHDTNVYTEKLNKYNIDKYVAISEAVYLTIQEHVPKAKIELIYNGIDLEKFKKKNNILKSNKSQEIIISCVARLMPEKKGQDLLIESLNIVKNKYKFNKFKCYFAGAISDNKSYKNLETLTAKYDLVDHIVFMGNVIDIENLYKKTDIFVLPSRYEGFGLVIVEALSSGCSVIVSKLEGPLEIVKENELYGLHFEKENINELADKLFFLMKDNKNLMRYKNNPATLRYLENNYSKEQMIFKYNKIYKECIGEKNGK